jgi:5-formyltetrahydrofolate cyclo-ligase
MKSWGEIRDWRRALRPVLIGRRRAVRGEERARVKEHIAELLLREVPELRAATIGFCWPFKGEIDCRALVESCLASGAQAALPAVVERGQPLEFWDWHPRMALQRGVWDIPVPAERRPVQPTILLVPLVGFDSAGYRLGYGGGYYDRTLAAMSPRPLAIGIGYELARLESIHPQWHDIPMDAIATEAGFTWLGPARDTAAVVDEEGAGSLASPPCMMHELDRPALGYLTQAEVLALLQELLEGERAGARALGAMSGQDAASSSRTFLRDIAMDEARCCAMLTRHIVRLGGTPSRRTGAFYDKLMGVGDPAQRLDLLNRGQGWVVRKLRDSLGRIHDDALHRDLTEMLDIHERNIASCNALSKTASPRAATR